MSSDTSSGFPVPGSLCLHKVQLYNVLPETTELSVGEPRLFQSLDFNLPAPEYIGASRICGMMDETTQSGLLGPTVQRAKKSILKHMTYSSNYKVSAVESLSRC
jgi:hypothetical protein